jgi:hypothetical protein
LVAAIFTSFTPTSGRGATGSLEEAVAGIAADVKELLKGKESVLTLAAFVPDPKSHVALQSSAGPAIVHELTRQLDLIGVKAQRVSTVTLSGSFREVEDQKGRQLVELDAKFYDREAGKESELSRRFVFNQGAVAHVLGIPLQ